MSRRTQRIDVVLSTAAMAAVLLDACIEANQQVSQPNSNVSTSVVTPAPHGPVSTAAVRTAQSPAWLPGRSPVGVPFSGAV